MCDPTTQQKEKYMYGLKRTTRLRSELVLPLSSVVEFLSVGIQ